MNSNALLATKLRPPLLPEKRVVRARLHQRLLPPHLPRLILISAPAGFGKTTLLTEWMQDGSQPVAWLTLDATDNDPAQFLAYLLATLQNVQPGCGQSIHKFLQTESLPADLTPLLVSLLNDLEISPHPCLLALDDYHIITAQPIHDALTFLLNNAPPRFCLALLTRSDPPLPLSRLRARGQLYELRATDLRFNFQETTTFLNQVMSLELSATQIAQLEARTEGWIAGLQLAALSLQGRADVTEFINTFSGSHHYVIDYLTDEVLERQPEEVRAFLLQTAVLDRLCAPLCDALTGRRDGQAMLEKLEVENLFLQPLDEERHWYRYHPLFVNVLLTRLRQQSPEQEAALQRQAAQWHAAHGLITQAIDYSIAAQDMDQAGRMLAQHWATLLSEQKLAQNQGWMRQLPEAVVRSAPSLGLVNASIVWSMGKVAAAEAELALTRHMVSQLVQAGKVQANDAEMDALALHGNVLASFIATANGRYAPAISLAQEIINHPAADSFTQGAGYNALCYALLESGQMATAVQVGEQGLQVARRSGNVAILANAARDFGLALHAQGRFNAAEGVLREALQRNVQSGQAQSPSCSLLHIELANVLLDRQQPEKALEHLADGIRLAEAAGFFVNLLLAAVPQARLRLAQGDLHGAYAGLLDLADRALQEEVTLFVRPLAAYRARLAALLGHRDEAQAWLDGENLAVENGRLGYEQAIVTLQAAHTLLALGRRAAAQQLAAQIMAAADAQGCLSWRQAAQDILHATGQKVPALAQVEPLSERELEVLALVATGASNQQIAAALYLATGTVKKHLHNIYAKLGVESRTQAIARARELTLL